MLAVAPVEAEGLMREALKRVINASDQVTVVADADMLQMAAVMTTVPLRDDRRALRDRTRVRVVAVYAPIHPRRRVGHPLRTLSTE
jgi:IS5 family transposase